MKHLLKALILALCLCSVSLASQPSKVIFDIEITSDELARKEDVVDEDKSWIADKAGDILSEVRELLVPSELSKSSSIKIDRAELAADNKKERSKRQLAIGGGLGLGFGAYDYNDYYGDYVGDYAYDYYDWICTDTACQLCDILTSECCDPDIDINCYLPDSCINNPCLSGGTCISSRTIDGRPDFVCACLPGLTGKYCQLANDYFVGAEAALAGAPMIPRATLPFAGAGALPFAGAGALPMPSAGALPYGGAAATPYAAPAASPYGGAVAASPYGAAAASPYSSMLSMQMPRAKRSLEDDMGVFLNEYKKLLSTLDLDSNFKFSCDAQGKGDERWVLWENGTKTRETYCQCFDKTFGSECKGTKVNCEDSTRRTSAGHYVPREYFVECTGNMPNVIKCLPGKIYDKEQHKCVSHKLKKTPTNDF